MIGAVDRDRRRRSGTGVHRGTGALGHAHALKHDRAGRCGHVARAEGQRPSLREHRDLLGGKALENVQTPGVITDVEHAVQADRAQIADFVTEVVGCVDGDVRPGIRGEVFDVDAGADMRILRDVACDIRRTSGRADLQRARRRAHRRELHGRGVAKQDRVVAATGRRIPGDQRALHVDGRGVAIDKDPIRSGIDDVVLVGLRH